MAKSKDRSNFHTVEKIGKTRELTPEGYLLCREVAIARTGEMLYAAGEVPVDDSGGIIIVTRSPEDLFNPVTMASFEGKAVTNDHPDDWVGPENWKDFAVGNCFNVHRGDGSEDNLLFADLLITDKSAIDDVNRGKVEISLGYDADYEQTSKGYGVQSNIIGNHVALVDNGRCGTRCAIGDSKTMADKSNQPKKPSLADRFRRAWMSKDAEAAEAAAKEAEEMETKDGDDDDPADDGGEDPKTKTGDAAILAAIRSLDAKNEKRFAALEKRFKDAESDPDKPPTDDDDDDDGKPTEDDVLKAEQASKKSEEGENKYTGDTLQNLRSRAEILSPGIKLPTLDAKSKDVRALAHSCKCKALTNAYATDDGRKAIDPFLNGNSDFAKLPKATVDAAFIGASELIRQSNNARGARSGIGTQDFGTAPKTPAQINQINRDFWSNKG